MTFPQYKSKHNEKALYDPKDLTNYKRWDSLNFPRKIIIAFQKSSLEYFKDKYADKTKGKVIEETHGIFRSGQIGFKRMGGIGSPHAITVIEELIALGANEFISLGTCGGLQSEGVFLCNKALRDEGTSFHYIAHGRFSYPDPGLTRKLGDSIKKLGVEYNSAPTWTTDAPYRETIAEVKRYREEGISTVEMEASALFSVAKYRKVKIASAFVVSDLLGDKWMPKLHNPEIDKTLNKLIDASVDCLGGKNEIKD